MMLRRIIRPPRHRHTREARTSRELDDRLLLGVWGINLNTNDVHHYAQSYLTHYNELRSLFEEDGLAQASRTEIVVLVHLVGNSQRKCVKDIQNDIRNANFRWMKDTGVQSIRNILDFTIRLWLFIEPDLSDDTLTLSEIVEKCLPRRCLPGRCLPGAQQKNRIPNISNNEPSPPRALLGYGYAPAYLPVDFSEKSLTKKASIKIEWSSYLPDHLTFVGKSRLRVFRHASAIQQHSKSSASRPYPHGFLQETERTLALLFDPLGNDTSKRTRRIERTNHVDLEAAIHSLVHLDDRLDLKNYPYWQERLRAVCKVYENSQPRTLRQWWFDRRNRFNWATFWVALVVFFLTLIFGVISSITGIMQVYAGFKALH